MKLTKSMRLMGMAALSAVSLSGCKENNSNFDKPGHSEEFVREGQSATAAPRAGDPAKDSPFYAAINAYLKLKDALVADDTELTATAGQELAGVVSGINLSLVDAQDLKGSIRKIEASATSISGGNLSEQRKHFEVISENMIELVKTKETGQPLYQQFCPMYNQNRGGVWLSSSKTIQNPYFGDKMLKCGLVQQEYN